MTLSSLRTLKRRSAARGAAGTECEGVTEGSYFNTDYTLSYTHFVKFLLLLLLTYRLYFRLFWSLSRSGVCRQDLPVLTRGATWDPRQASQSKTTTSRPDRDYTLPSGRGNSTPGAPAESGDSAARNKEKLSFSACVILAKAY